jgi:universal stress protein A
VKSLTIRQILVPIDFSDMSIGAIQPAKNLARRFNASVHLVHVHWFDYPAGFTALPGPVPGLSTTVQKEVERSLTARLQEVASEFELPPANCHLCIGAPVFDEISHLAQELPADLIVTSTHGYGGVKHFFLGSTAERLVQHAPCPVLVSRKGRATIDKILVPVDFSRCSLEGLKYAIQFADQFASKLFILHAVYLGRALHLRWLRDVRPFGAREKGTEERRTTNAALCATDKIRKREIRNSGEDGSSNGSHQCLCREGARRLNHHFDARTNRLQTRADGQHSRRSSPSHKPFGAGRPISS